MPEGLGLLSGLGDLYQTGTAEPPPSKEEADIRQKMAELELKDPFMAVILASPNISPQVKAFLRADEDRRIQTEKLNIEMRRLKA